MEKSIKKQQKFDCRIDKTKKLCTYLANMNSGETISISDLHKKTGVHFNTIRDILDSHDSLDKVDYVVIRNSNGKIRLIIKNSGNNDIKEILKEIQKKLIDIDYKLGIKK